MKGLQRSGASQKGRTSNMKLTGMTNSCIIAVSQTTELTGFCTTKDTTMLHSSVQSMTGRGTVHAPPHSIHSLLQNQWCTAEHSMAKYSIAQHGTAQRSSTQGTTRLGHK